jgi:flavodoxin
MKTLVVYYSRTGNTKMIAETISESLDCDIEEIVDKEKRGGIIGYLKSGYEASRNKLSIIEDPIHDLSKYDLLIVGTPVWAGKMSVPLRTYLHKNMEKIPLLACFCTAGRSGIDDTIKNIGEYTSTTPIESFGLTSSDIKSGSYKAVVEKFVQDLG